MSRHQKNLEWGVDSVVDNEKVGNKVAEVKSGSVVISIFKSQNSLKVPKKPIEGAPAGSEIEFETKYYDSYVIPFFEGSIRKTPRRSTLEKAMKFAKETADRLNKDGAKAVFLSERDRRIYILAKASAIKLGMDADVACRKLVELQERLKTGTLEQAVDFHNDHGQRVRHGVANTEIYREYHEHLDNLSIFLIYRATDFVSKFFSAAAMAATSSRNLD